MHESRINSGRVPTIVVILGVRITSMPLHKLEIQAGFESDSRLALRRVGQCYANYRSFRCWLLVDLYRSKFDNREIWYPEEL